MYKLTGYIIRREDGTLPVRCKSNYPPIYDRFDAAKRALEQTNPNHKILLVGFIEVEDAGRWQLYDPRKKELHPSVFCSRKEAEDFRCVMRYDEFRYEIVLLV